MLSLMLFDLMQCEAYCDVSMLFMSSSSSESAQDCYVVILIIVQKRQQVLSHLIKNDNSSNNLIDDYGMSEIIALITMLFFVSLFAL